MGEEEIQLAVRSKVKEYCKAHNFRVSGDFMEGLDRKIAALLVNAIDRCGGNNRQTIKAIDL